MPKKYIKNLISVILCVCVIVSLLITAEINTSAIQYPCKGIVIQDSSPVRSAPGTAGHEAEGSPKSEQITTLKINTEVRVIGEGIDGDGDRWYQIGYGTGYSSTGYMYCSRVALYGIYYTDEKFENYLTEQGFPESYKPSLRSLHALYPAWVFKADITNLDFKTAADNEYKGNGKYTSASGNDGYKCMEQGFYDWEKGTYKYTEGTSWVKASRGTLEYYMDPRNFLDDKSIFTFLDQNYTPGTATIEQVQDVIKGTFMKGALEDNSQKTYAQVILEAAEQYKMSPFAVAGLIRIEQGNKGTSSLIAGKGTPSKATGETVYEGYYNYFNVGAYEAGGMTVAERGLWYAKGGSNNSTTYSRPWNTREKAIKGGVEFSVDNYVSEGQNTFYYMNYNVYNTKNPYTHQYAANVADSVGKGRGVADAFFDAENVPIVFHIPVYKNMPEKTNLAPAKTNNDCYLSELSVKDYESDIKLNRYVNNYETILPYSAKTVEIIAKSAHESTVISGAGEVNLKVGDNVIPITVTASSGVKNTYTLSIYRQPGSEEVKEPTLNTKYKLDTYLTGVSPETGVADFIKNLGIKDGTAKVLDSEENLKTSGNVSTGDAVYIYNLNNEAKQKINVLIYGDVNGDGKITSVDMLGIQKNIFKINKLSAVKLLAADVNNDGKITSVDMLGIQKHIFRITTILQVR